MRTHRFLKKYLLAATATAALLFSACDLDEHPTSFVGPKEYYKTRAQCLAGLNACYIPINSIYDYCFLIMTEGVTDLMYIASGTKDAQLDISPAKPLNGQKIWTQCYKGVMYCNSTIAAIERSPLNDIKESSEADKLPLLAEGVERIDILGQSGHSSDPSLGHSALEAMHAAIGELLALRAQWQKEYNNPQFGVPQPTLNLGCIHGGDNPNRICGQCALEFDLRPLPGMDPQALRRAIGERLQPLAERFAVRLDYQPLFPAVPPFEQAADSELVRLAERLSGHSAEAVAFGTEAPYLQQLGCQTLVLGPGDIACAHQPDEHLELARIPPTVELLRGLIQHYCL